MKRLALYALAIILVVTGIFLLLQLYNNLKPEQTGALQVSANIISDVYLDGKHVGKTPFCRGDFSICAASKSDEESLPLSAGQEKVSVGTHTIKIVPEDSSLSPYVVKVDVLPNVMTAVDRTFLSDGLSSTYILTLEKSNGEAGIFVQSIPSNAVVAIDGVTAGVTPLRDEEISVSEHVIEIQKEEFAKKTIRVRAVEGYLLVVNVILGAESPDAEPVEEDESGESEEASASGSVRILDTPTGFLRVRTGPGIGNEEITTVGPGSEYVLLDEEDGWFEIKVDEEVSGWVSEEFTEKVEKEN